MNKIETLKKQREEIIEKINDPKLCEGTADVYSRISGYYRNIALYNKGKQSEFNERKTYKI